MKKTNKKNIGVCDFCLEKKEVWKGKKVTLCKECSMLQIELIFGKESRDNKSCNTK